MNLTKNKITLFIVLCCFLYIAYSSVYTVSEGYTALLLPSNGLKKISSLDSQTLQEPGLHFKLPFVVQVTLIDRRLHNFSSKKLSLFTLDQQPLVVDYYAMWSITQPTIYYLQTYNDLEKTRQQLTEKINALLQSTFARTTRQAILGHQQTQLLNAIVEQANHQLQVLGVTLVKLGLNSIDFLEEANSTILREMRSKQIRIALEQRAIGKSDAEYIRANANNRAALQLAKATEEAANIRGQGDASAAKIYSEAYRKNQQFAAFYLKLEAYRKGFSRLSSSNNFLVLNTKDIAPTHFKDR